MKNSTPVPQWLQNLQHNSWHAEILLSGLILFSLTRAPKAMEKFFAYLVQEYGLRSGGYESALILIETGIIWLIIGFILHLTIRGSWIGLVGLTYIFPAGIRHENLPYQDKFANLLARKPALVQLAIQVDKIASGVFSIAYYSFMSTLGLAISGLTLGLGGYHLTKAIAGTYSDLGSNIHNLIMTAIFLIYTIDFLSLGGLKRIKWFQPVYFPLYRFISMLMLAPFYRHIYYAFVSNISKWKIVVGVFSYFILSILLVIYLGNTRQSDDTTFSAIDFYSRSRGLTIFHGHYESLNAGNYSLMAHIQSDIITGNTIRLFVVHDAKNEDRIKEMCNYDESLKNFARDSMGLACMEQFYQVFLDDSLYEHSPWLYHEKQATKQKGILCWIDVEQLPKGTHILKIAYFIDKRQRIHAQLPFYKE